LEEDDAVPNDVRRIEAYEIHPPRDMAIVKAPYQRDWMDATNQRFAYHCLPLVIANQAGWLISNPASFSACWNGGIRRDDLTLDFGTGPNPGSLTFQTCVGAEWAPAENRITSHFGSGIVTFTLPYLFRTPPGVNLWVKGPSNCVKDGVCPLEGIVEADWSAATFTMNWKLTRPGTVRFERGEPICMIVPVLRGLAESLEARQAPLASNPEVEEAFHLWEAGRSQFLLDLAQRQPEAVARGWQKDYFQGRGAEGARAEGHQTRVQLKEFVRDSS
jgi:hypothetical protein